MENSTDKFYHLIINLEKISNKKSILNCKYGERAFLSLGKGNVNDWLNSLLPNTRLIIEPKINGICLAIHYRNGELQKVITKNGKDLTFYTKLILKIPKDIPVKQSIEILGELYRPIITTTGNQRMKTCLLRENTNKKEELNFCAFQILNCKLNHFQSIQELQRLKFEIPETEITKDVTDVHLFQKYYKDGKIFNKYPTKGIVLKVNSKKFQKYLGENKISINWAYTFY